MQQIEKFLAVAQAVCDEHMQANFPNNPRHVLSIDPKGRKYAKGAFGKGNKL